MLSARGSSPTAGPRVLVCACVLVLIYINKLTQTTQRNTDWLYPTIVPTVDASEDTPTGCGQQSGCRVAIAGTPSAVGLGLGTMFAYSHPPFSFVLKKGLSIHC